jgi:hypothetical protein
MIAPSMTADEQEAAKLLWEVKVIATREFESLPSDFQQNIFINDVVSVTSEDYTEEYRCELPDRRQRTVSIESMDLVTSTASSPKLSSRTIAIIDARFTDSPAADSDIEHYDWSKRVNSTLLEDSLAAPSLVSSPPTVLITQKYGKRKRENYVGLSTKAGSVRATLRKKFSWKQFPEVSSTGSTAGPRQAASLNRFQCPAMPLYGIITI